VIVHNYEHDQITETACMKAGQK